jgi:hypothetical protein
MVLLEQHMEMGSLVTTSGWPPFYAPTNILVWSLYNKCSLWIHISTGPTIQIPAFSQGILSTHELSVQFYGDLWRLHGSNPETSTTTTTLHHPIVSRKQIVIATFPNKSWVFVSEGGLVGYANLKDR